MIQTGRRLSNFNGGMQLENDLNVFKCANRRYRQTVATNFIISNKVITYAAIISVLLLFFGIEITDNFGKAIGLGALFFAIHRRALYLGFYDGYERGHTDAIEKPNNLNTFTDSESEVYWQDKEIEGYKKNRFI